MTDAVAGDFVLVALAGAYRSSVGALTDSFLLAAERVEKVFTGSERVRMETRLRILSPDGAAVRLADGSMLAVDGSLDEQVDSRFIWLPAFRAGGEALLVERLGQLRPLIAWLRRQHDRGATIGASGASALLLTAAGLTGPHAIPVARAAQPLFRHLYPRQKIEDRLALLDAGSLLVANGIAADLRLIVRVLERMISPEVARWVTSIIGLDGEEAHLVVDDVLVARAQLWIEQEFTRPINLADLASRLSTSTATLNRRFRKALGLSPKAYIQQMRLDAAMRMLEMTRRPIDRIAEQVGYADSRQFRAMFRQQTGMTASQWREQEKTKGGAGSLPRRPV